MSRISWKLSLTVATALFIWMGTQRASAQGVVVTPAVRFLLLPGAGRVLL